MKVNSIKWNTETRVSIEIAGRIFAIEKPIWTHVVGQFLYTDDGIYHAVINFATQRTLITRPTTHEEDRFECTGDYNSQRKTIKRNLPEWF